MKVFVAEKRKQGYKSPTDYHWCDDNDLLMFGQFQLGNGNPSEVSMCGIQSRKFTTHIIVKDLKIDKDFYKELITESVEKAMDCKVDRNGDFSVDIAWGFHFNINDIINELLEKASQFEDGQKVKCYGRTLFLYDA
jgi:diaminopimelate epimerase